MDDNRTIKDENQPAVTNATPLSEEQPTPIFESVPIEEAPPQENVQVEELPPDVTAPGVEEVSPQEAGMPPDVPPLSHDDSRGKYLVVAFGAIIFFLLLFFFLKTIFGSKPKSEEVKLTYWGLWEDKEVFLPLIDQYRQNNPHVTVEYIKMTPQDYREKLLARSKNGQGPDIFRFHNTWLPEIKDVVTPIPSSVMSNTEFEKTFYKIHQTDLKAGDHYYGLPLTVDGLVMICNDNLLKGAGVEKPPVTWDELTDALGKLTVKDRSGQLITAGIALGTTTNIEHYSDIIGLMLIQNGGDIKKLNEAEAAGALESYRRFAEPPQKFWDENMPNSVTAFIQEKVAMIIAPSWQILTIKTANPDIKIKVVPVPYVPGASPVSVANYWVEGVSRYSQNQLEAWKFLKFLTEKDSLTKLYELQSRIRLFGEPYPRVDLASLIVQNEYVGAVVRQADVFVSLPMISRTYDNGLNDEIVKYIENAVNAAAQGVSYSEALKTAKQGVDQVFSKYKIE
jgi:multiple sugar transport system substrate-binding protein